MLSEKITNAKKGVGLAHVIFSISTQGIVNLLHQSDAQLFEGWGGHSSIRDPTIAHKLDSVANRLAALLQVHYTYTTFSFMTTSPSSFVVTMHRLDFCFHRRMSFMDVIM